MSVGRYSMLVLAISVTTLALAWPLALQRLEPVALAGVAFGATLALANTVAAHALVRWSQGRSTTDFMRAILGGMAARMALMLAAVVAGILALGLPRLPLVVSLLFYFAVFLSMELSILHRQTGTPQGTAR